MNDVMDIFDKGKKELPEIRYVLPGSQEELLLRPFNTREQKVILKAMEKGDQILVGEAFDDLIKSCVVRRGFNVEDLFSKDRECLLIKLRLESVKGDFSHSWTCEQCKTANTYEIDLTKVPYEDNIKRGFMSKEVKLENNNASILLSLSTRGDEKKIMRHAKKNTSSIKNEISQTELLTAAYASVIKAIKTNVEEIDQETGEKKMVEKVIPLSFDDRLKILEKLSLNDRDEIKKFFEQLENYGYDLKIGQLTCSNCSHEQEESLDWMSFFIM